MCVNDFESTCNWLTKYTLVMFHTLVSVRCNPGERGRGEVTFGFAGIKKMSENPP